MLGLHRSRACYRFVLDLSFTTTATAGAAAIRQTADLGKRLSGWAIAASGWQSTTTSASLVASGAPEIMIGAIAAATVHIRVGAGGVMLLNHAPLMVAERFKVLEALLYPGRIDLGIGRASGTDPRPRRRCVTARR